MTKLRNLLLATLTLCYMQSVQINLFSPLGPIKTFETDLTNLPTVKDLKRHIMAELHQLPEFSEYNGPGEVIELVQGTERNLSLPSNNDQILNITVLKTRRPFFWIREELSKVWSADLEDWVKVFSGFYSQGGNFELTFRYHCNIKAQKAYFIENLSGGYLEFTDPEFDNRTFRLNGTDADLDFIESEIKPD